MKIEGCAYPYGEKKSICYSYQDIFEKEITSSRQNMIKCKANADIDCS